MHDELGGDTSPENANQLMKFDWYKPQWARKVVSEKLEGQPTGTFYVRESASQPGCYAVAVSLGDSVWHGVISVNNGKNGEIMYKLYTKAKFPSIPELISYYHEHTIAKDKEGNTVKLIPAGGAPAAPAADS